MTAGRYEFLGFRLRGTSFTSTRASRARGVALKSTSSITHRATKSSSRTLRELVCELDGTPFATNSMYSQKLSHQNSPG